MYSMLMRDKYTTLFFDIHANEIKKNQYLTILCYMEVYTAILKLLLVVNRIHTTRLNYFDVAIFQ